MRKTPVVFVGHGSPTEALLEGEYRSALQREFGNLPDVRAIVCLSAHWWMPEVVGISSGEHPQLIYDFGGFQRSLYEFKYPVTGSPDVATEVATALSRSGFRPQLDPHRGLDHGVWVPLSVALPEASVPIVQISLPYPEDAETLVRFAHALVPLREQGVLFVASGNLVHNLREVVWNSYEVKEKERVPLWAREFEGWMVDKIDQGDAEALLEWQVQAPHSQRAHPSADHLWPVLVALALTEKEEPRHWMYRGFHYGSISMSSFRIGAGL